MIKKGGKYKSRSEYGEMSWANHILTIEDVLGDPENPNTEISFSAGGKVGTCRVNWLEGFWDEEGEG